MMPPLVYLRVYDAISVHAVTLLDSAGDATNWRCSCGCLFGYRDQPPQDVSCPYELVWSRTWWPGAGDRWWER
jgi:hypothetical protein